MKPNQLSVWGVNTDSKKSQSNLEEATGEARRPASLTMTTRPIKSVLFDLDNTLIDRSEAFQRLFEHWHQTLPSLDRPADREAFVSRMARRGNGYEPIPDIYQDVLDEWPGSFSSLDSAVETHFKTMPKVVALHPETEAMLRRLRSHGVPVGVVTNGSSKTQWGKLRNTGIAALVETCVVSEDFGTRKPDPAIFRHALGLIGAEAESTLFVGDNVEHDIIGAFRANMQTAWVSLGRAWDPKLPYPDYVINEVWEVERLVRLN